MAVAKKQGKGTKGETVGEGGGMESQEIVIKPFKRGRLKVALLGVTPFICNRQSEKTKRELLYPAPKKKPEARERHLKHDPLKEYRDSPYVTKVADGPTAIVMKGAAFKSAACDSAVDSATLKAAQVRRLVQVPEFYVPIYGKPMMFITDVKSSGMNRTPDMRTRAIIPEWCAIVTFVYVTPHLNEEKLLHLIANGGMTRGVGDGRTEKGALDFGQYTVVSLDDPTVQEIMKVGGRLVQESALQDPEFFDEETEELYAWFCEERIRREKEGLTDRKVEDDKPDLAMGEQEEDGDGDTESGAVGEG